VTRVIATGKVDLFLSLYAYSYAKDQHQLYTSFVDYKLTY